VDPEQVGAEETRMFKPTPGLKYDMPAVFGPSLLPDVTTFGRVDMVSISYVTTVEAASALVPYHFRLPSEPVVTFSRMTYSDVDYLGGRGYHELTVGISAFHESEVGRVAGSYMPVIWIDDGAALVAGREYMGYAKIEGALPPVASSDTARDFEVREYGALLLSGHLEDLAPLDETRMEGARAAAKNVTVLGWKYIAGPGGTVDADYPTAIALSFAWSSGWRAQGCVRFEQPTPASAPFSSRVVSSLAELPVVRYRPAFIASGTGIIDRGATRRLPQRCLDGEA
jgi:hypothetical protein